ncbi:histidine kinase [Natrarchaeobius halalkaliphilus]|uniref:Histidine kinase n=1 Tax=Natrarchaeobius halalkaliphilus TaxID=1679091 RepID=A0A3N6LP43_9EURY|nr:DICT sensory domain-containing protein [Natrarchaeobius halalkaliphilus]RQG89847.1 histidine kinase [Natrarchaeobius halalkaliphilus]
MNGLRDAIDEIEAHRKRLEVYTDDPRTAAELKRQFSTQNVDVEHRPTTILGDPGFVVIRTSGGEFRGALGLDQFAEILSPDIHPPWVLSDSPANTSVLFDFLENTLFGSYSRRQMLATSREIEERAVRIGDGRLYTGFQRERAALEQTAVYDRLANHKSLSVTVFVDGKWSKRSGDVTVVTDTDGEIGDYWFVIFDGAGVELQRCALLAEERKPGRYYGFWTYDPDLVSSLVGHLATKYDLE